MSSIWTVAVNAPLKSPLTYIFPDVLENEVLPEPGHSVVVPLGKSKKAYGVLIEKTTPPENIQLKEVLSVDMARPVLSEARMKWLKWLSEYYVYPFGQVLELSFAPLNKQEKARASSRAPVIAAATHRLAPKHTVEQEEVIAAIAQHEDFSTHLIFGVTGSGKTEIYISLLEKVIERGEQGIVLVPEISLTPQLIERFSARLGSHIAAIHSHLTPREKTNQWWDMYENKKQILIGARSALFCPIQKLGLIVVDEEHESSFKQDEKLKYHARDAAIMLGKFSNCPVVLGSATPSLESWNNAVQGRFLLHELKNRVENRPMPRVEIIDLKTEQDDNKSQGKITDRPFWMSARMQEVLDETFARKEQSALFLNRRGMAQSVICPACAHSPECPNCAVKLTLHGRNHLLCHYCGYQEKLTSTCDQCKQGEPKPVGLGTEQIEKEIQKLYPSSQVLRMDRDEIDSREALETAIQSIEFGPIDFIVGTQMIAKGLDFPRLTTVAIVMADIAFNLPDFRASERSFQLLTQVSGRSGRHVAAGGSGQVLIQTYNPDHPSVQFAQNHDFKGFADYELEFRKALTYPPFGRLAVLRMSGPSLDAVTEEAEFIKRLATGLKNSAKAYDEIELLGPAPAPMQKVRNKYRFQMLMKSIEAQKLSSFCQRLMTEHKKKNSRVQLAIDMDAVNLL